MIKKEYYENLEGAIAIIGMSGSFSKAQNIDEYWQNLLAGRECIDDLTDMELIAAGISEELYSNPDYVKRTASLESAKKFDPAFFNYTPGEARMMDPQHRIFLEHAWKCLEDGGYDSSAYDGLIGVYAGCGQNNYLIKHLISSRERMDSLEAFQLMLGNDKDYLATRTSYKLNLKGPSMNIQTACSTSAVAIQQTCLSLLNYQCDMALTGGVSINVPHRGGYEFKDGLILSPDGHCRTFDVQANGTVFGDGVGILLLKRLEDALEDKDHIYALIRGAAVNNDGSEKVSFTAPGVKAQAEVIATAIALAEIPTESIGYVEAHGTGTLLGDPIEVAALTEAFRMDTQKKNFCVLGSVKPNIGHLDAGAGVAGVIKTVKMLQEGVFPPQVNYSIPNPALELAESPFKINRELTEWERKDFPRRAGVTSLGVGGTNVHLIMEEYIPVHDEDNDSEDMYILPLSAKSPESLRLMKDNLVTFVKKDNTSLTNTAYTLQTCRKEFPYRDALTVKRGKDNFDAFLNKPIPSEKAKKSPVVFLFSGQGSQYPNMGKQLYKEISYVRELMDRCFSLLEKENALSLKSIIFPVAGDEEKNRELLQETVNAQPALFILEYAIAKYLMEFNIKPDYLLGHSMGEYTAACLAGVFSLEDGLSLVAERGRIMQKAQKGAMLSVALGEKELELYLNGKNDLQAAVINAPGRCVVSGTYEAVRKLRELLNSKDIPCSLLKTSHAYHSFMMENILEEYEEKVKTVRLNSPTIPLVSNIKGDFISPGDLSQAKYWGEELRSTVRFGDCISSIFSKAGSAKFIEIGPGNTLCSFVKMNTNTPVNTLAQSTVRGAKQKISDMEFFFKSLGKLWERGCELNWQPLIRGRRNTKISIPTYTYDHSEYWITQDFSTEKNSRNDSDVTKEEKAQNSGINKSSNEQLKDIWMETFGTSEIHEQSDFFDLGGDSLLAVRLCDTLNKAFDVSIPLGTLFKATTFSEQYKLIKSAGSDLKSTSLIALSRNGKLNAPHLFCICGIAIYQHLADAIGPPFNISGVFLPVEQELLMDQKELPSLQEMATMYKEIIRMTQPHGPYYIAGLSFGGILAYELARQLMLEGEEIKILSLFDSKLLQETSRLKRVSLHLKAFRLNDTYLLIRKIKNRFLRLLKNISGKKKYFKLEKINDYDLIDRRQIIYRNAAMKYYESMPHYKGSAMIFKALDGDPFENMLYKDKDDLGWKDYIHGDLTCHKIHGDHLSILKKENVEQIACVLREELAR